MYVHMYRYILRYGQGYNNDHNDFQAQYTFVKPLTQPKPQDQSVADKTRRSDRPDTKTDKLNGILCLVPSRQDISGQHQIVRTGQRDSPFRSSAWRLHTEMPARQSQGSYQKTLQNVSGATGDPNRAEPWPELSSPTTLSIRGIIKGVDLHSTPGEVDRHRQTNTSSPFSLCEAWLGLAGSAQDDGLFNPGTPGEGGNAAGRQEAASVSKARPDSVGHGLAVQLQMHCAKGDHGDQDCTDRCIKEGLASRVDY
ncbi:uncharacterized protein N7459_002547 [Penicillium hispanicum]|uniref:uncharacterized protein n=1 Tax=Penicillium hispanicum TaxID=1080232 RepID=UPI0025418878|nr:uncharacterized protein N7459_002547 [Penicillium hispanicum]KAJ5586782.1 hypothetical protein N7459_002547 [Penicillium hispanicum]